MGDIYSSFTQTDSFCASRSNPSKSPPRLGLSFSSATSCLCAALHQSTLPFSRPYSSHASSLILFFSSSTRRSLELSTGSPCNCWVRETGASSRRCFTQPHLLLPSPSYTSYDLTSPLKISHLRSPPHLLSYTVGISRAQNVPQFTTNPSTKLQKHPYTISVVAFGIPDHPLHQHVFFRHPWCT